MTHHFISTLPTRDRGDGGGPRRTFRGGYFPDAFLDDGSCPASYFDNPPVATPTTVQRDVWDRAPYSGICSTDFRTARVTLPRISMIDGQYRRAANDNSLDARQMEALRVAA